MAQKKYAKGYMWIAVFSGLNFDLRKIHQNFITEISDNLKASGITVYGPAHKYAEVNHAAKKHVDDQINALRELRSKIVSMRQHLIKAEG